MGLTLQKQKFVEEFLNDPNTSSTDRKVRAKAIQGAVLRAGYSANRLPQRAWSLMHELDILDAIQAKQQDEYTLSAELSPELVEKWVRELMAACKKRGTGSWQASTIMRGLELLVRLKGWSERPPEQPKPAIQDPVIEARIEQLEVQLGIQRPAEPPPQPAPICDSAPISTKRATLPAMEHKPPPPPVLPDPNMPDVPMAHCDKHGPFELKKTDPCCPTCRKEWRAASDADERYLSRLLPGVM